MKVLHVDSSILGDASVSRKLTAAVVERITAAHPQAKIVHRDVAAEPVPWLTGPLAMTLGKDPADIDPELTNDAAKLRAALDAVLAADMIVVGVPMYNFGVPAQLKAWMDSLAVAGTTFRYVSGGSEGLLGAKRLIIASSQGGVYREGTPAASMEHQQSHVQAFFTFLGVTDQQIVRADGTKLSQPAEDQGLEAGLKQVEALEV